MREDLSSRISSVLLSYTKEQAFMEFLANAADARATEFGVTLDAIQHHPPENHQFISPSLKGLCSQPSLIICNNGLFSSSDWKEICNVGSSNKQENTDGKLRIGRFGLGSLSMFYFTEVFLHFLFMDIFLNPQFLKGCNDCVWSLCSIHGSQEGISWQGSFMLQGIFGYDEKVCPFYFGVYSIDNLYNVLDFFLHISLHLMVITVINSQWMNTMGSVFLTLMHY